jgi:hypothetical protein
MMIHMFANLGRLDHNRTSGHNLAGMTTDKDSQDKKRVQGPASYFPSIEKKYGRPIAEWQALIRSSPLTKHMELVNWLKVEYGMGHGHANALVGYTLHEDAPDS